MDRHGGWNPFLPTHFQSNAGRELYRSPYAVPARRGLPHLRRDYSATGKGWTRCPAMAALACGSSEDTEMRRGSFLAAARPPAGHGSGAVPFATGNLIPILPVPGMHQNFPVVGASLSPFFHA